MEDSGIKPVVIREICELAGKYNVDRVVLFGSRARGDYKRVSDIDLAVSVPNRGAILDMAEDDVVEVTCTIGKDGAVPMSFSREEIAPSNLLLMKTIKRYEKLTVEAVRKKSKEAAVEALTIHPLVADYGLAVKLVEAYCAHNLPWIGEWK